MVRLLGRIGGTLASSLLLITVWTPAVWSSDATDATDATDVEGRWVWPLTPRPVVVRGFDPPAEPWGSGHRGVDLAGRDGQRVRAAAAGRVTYAGMIAGRGVVVVAHRGGLRTTYEPVIASARPGDRVGAGDRIGTLGLEGGHCLPRACLHWGLLRGDAYLDPLGNLRTADRPRLLPLGADRAEPFSRAEAVGRDVHRQSVRSDTPGYRALAGAAASLAALGLLAAGFLVRPSRPRVGLGIRAP